MLEEQLVKVFVVEDELLIADDIALKLEQLGYDVIGEYTQGEEVIEALNVGKIPDFIIMDIHLDGSLDGIETVENFKGRFNIPVIYLTDDHHKNTLKRASKTNPVNYLLKPFNDFQLKVAIDLVLFDVEPSELGKSEEEVSYRLNDAIFIKNKNKFIKLELSQVIRLDGDRMYTDIVTSHKTYKVTGSINKVKDNFYDPFFIKVHRSHVINMNKVISFEGNTIFFENGSVTVSKQYRSNFFKRFRIM